MKTIECSVIREPMTITEDTIFVGPPNGRLIIDTTITTVKRPLTIIFSGSTIVTTERAVLDLACANVQFLANRDLRIQVKPGSEVLASGDPTSETPYAIHYTDLAMKAGGRVTFKEDTLAAVHKELTERFDRLVR